jgi:glycosyltransferase involved in cell wall biosynthesis
VVPPEDAQELEFAIRELAADPERRKAMGENGRRYVEREFDREKITAELEDFLHQHLRHSRLSPS